MRSQKLTVCLVALVGVFGISSNIAGQTLRDQVRELGGVNPQPLNWPAPPAELWPKTIDEVAQEADLIVQAKLLPLKSYLGPREDSILTDYAISDVQVIAGRLPVLSTRTPGTQVPPVLTVYGGEVTVDGVLVRGRDWNFEPIKDGGSYLLMLKESTSEERGRYRIYHGGLFEIVQEDVTPLVKRADAIFKSTVPNRVGEFISRIQKARAAQR